MPAGSILLLQERKPLMSTRCLSIFAYVLPFFSSSYSLQPKRDGKKEEISNTKLVGGSDFIYIYIAHLSRYPVRLVSSISPYHPPFFILQLFWFFLHSPWLLFFVCALTAIAYWSASFSFPLASRLSENSGKEKNAVSSGPSRRGSSWWTASPNTQLQGKETNGQSIFWDSPKSHKQTAGGVCQWVLIY